MNVVLFEYISSGAYQHDLSLDLSREANLMVRAAAQGLIAAGCQVVVFRDERLSPLDLNARIVTIGTSDDWRALLTAELSKADAFLPIAPESNRQLEMLCRFADNEPCLLLNSPPTIVAATASKGDTLKCLREHKILCVDCCRVHQCRFPFDIDVVLKPDDGVACDDTFLIRAGQIPEAAQLQKAALCQPYLLGTAASINVIYGKQSQPCVLGINRQEVVIDERGEFRLQACHVNELAQLALPFEALAESVEEAFRGMVGHVGIDFVIEHETIYILEVNPRLTTSFAGLAQTTGINPMDLILAAARGEPLACPSRADFSSLTIRID